MKNSRILFHPTACAQAEAACVLPHLFPLPLFAPTTTPIPSSPPSPHTPNLPAILPPLQRYLTIPPYRPQSKQPQSTPEVQHPTPVPPAFYGLPVPIAIPNKGMTFILFLYFLDQRCGRYGFVEGGQGVVGGGKGR